MQNIDLSVFCILITWTPAGLHIYWLVVCTFLVIFCILFCVFVGLSYIFCILFCIFIDIFCIYRSNTDLSVFCLYYFHILLHILHILVHIIYLLAYFLLYLIYSAYYFAYLWAYSNPQQNQDENVALTWSAKWKVHIWNGFREYHSR